MNRAMLLVLSLLVAGCTTSAEEGGVPAPSWMTAPKDDTLAPRRGTQDFERPTVAPARTRDRTSALPGDNFPYNVGTTAVPSPRTPVRLTPLRPHDSATLYPSDAEAARAAGSATLYPPAGRTFNPDFGRSPTFYPPHSRR